MKLIALFGCIIPVVFAGKDAVPPKSVDEWTAEDIASYIKTESKVQISEDILIENEIAPKDLFDGILLQDSVLESIGVTEPIAKERVKNALGKLDAKMTAEPSNALEWRLANRRLFDFWFLPLASISSRATLIWLRFFHDDSNSAIDRYDGHCDESSGAYFWAEWVVTPSYPLARMARSLNIPESSIDGMIIGTLSVRIVVDFLFWAFCFYWQAVIIDFVTVMTFVACIPIFAIFLAFGMKPGDLLKIVRDEVEKILKPYIFLLPFAIIGIFMALGFFVASFSYYVLWHIIPPAIEEGVLAFVMFVAIPGVSVFALYSLLVGGSSKNKPKKID
mmetsp:Transcript_4521/g.10649  ORF Transcript_4521/g.10649 Transcript_4521/m.10649 type:complete len:333 (+) Transcript_4521:29-1027(+)